MLSLLSKAILLVTISLTSAQLLTDEGLLNHDLTHLSFINLLFFAAVAAVFPAQASSLTSSLFMAKSSQSFYDVTIISNQSHALISLNKTNTAIGKIGWFGHGLGTDMPSADPYVSLTRFGHDEIIQNPDFVCFVVVPSRFSGLTLEVKTGPSLNVYQEIMSCLNLIHNLPIPPFSSTTRAR
jgi:hypothetical protein